MRKIVDTHTGRIVVDTDLSLEYLFVETMVKKTTSKLIF